VKQGKPE